jgi:hypothetical protein
VRKSPPSTTFALGSPRLTPLSKALRSFTYCFGFGLWNQKVGEFISFQSCQSITGSFGIDGLLDQKVPLLP